MSALFLACCQGHESCARLLIEKGADVHLTARGLTVLMFAQHCGHTAICALLEA